MIRRYFRPTGFVDTPVGFDGQVARLAGGLCFFATWEVIAPGRKTLVPVGALQPEDDAEVAIIARVTSPRPPLKLGERTIPLDQPRVMGILNVTPDSFSDGGRYADAEAAAAAGSAMADAGASLIDVGGESTRPGAQPAWEGDEIARVMPVVERLAHGGATVSIDTRKASVMEAALAAGAEIVNDVSALSFDKAAVTLLAARDCPIVIMHSPDATGGLHESGGYQDVLTEVYDWLDARIAALEAAGIARARLIIDPGIGFGKSLADNLALLNGLSLFHGLGCPVLIGASRKRFIGALSNEAPVEQRLGGSLAVAVETVRQGVQLVRVHDVLETVQALQIWRGLRDRALSA